MPRLAHSLNRAVFVAIPDFFGDPDSRQCTLVDIESSGVWLRGGVLNERLAEITGTELPDTPANVFFPFDQVIYVFDPAQFAFLARRRVEPAAAAPGEPPRRAHKVEGRNERPKQKTSRRTR